MMAKDVFATSANDMRLGGFGAVAGKSEKSCNHSCAIAQIR